MDNCVKVRHVFIMERLALMNYLFVLCIVAVHWSLLSPSQVLSAVRVLYVRQKLPLSGPLVGENARAVFCPQSVTDCIPAYVFLLASRGRHWFQKEARLSISL